MSLQPERIREPNPDAEDEAHDADVQRRADDERAAEIEAKRAASGVIVEEFLAAPQPPKRIACHACDHPYAGAVCPLCKEERPVYTALKRLGGAK